jgi:hypothetical protein
MELLQKGSCSFVSPSPEMSFTDYDPTIISNNTNIVPNSTVSNVAAPPSPCQEGKEPALYGWYTLATKGKVPIMVM